MCSNMYNLMNGMNASLLAVASARIGVKIDEVFPRFRDVFNHGEDVPEGVGDYDLLVYTRMGGGNSECWEDSKDNCTCPACTMDNLVEDSPWIIFFYDDDFDSTYRTFVIRYTDEQRAKTPEEIKKTIMELYQPKGLGTDE